MPSFKTVFKCKGLLSTKSYICTSDQHFKQKNHFFYCSRFEKELIFSSTLNQKRHWYKCNSLVWVLKCFSSGLNQSNTLSKILQWYIWAHHFLLFSRLSKLFLWKIISCLKKQLKVLGRLLHLDLAKIGSNP